MVHVRKSNVLLVKKHRELDTGIEFIYVTLIIVLFFTVNHELPHERIKTMYTRHATTRH